MHIYEVRPRKNHRGGDLIFDALPLGGLWYVEASDAIGYAKFRSRSRDAVIRVYDDAGNVIETHEHAGRGAPARTRRHPDKELTSLLTWMLQSV